MMLRAMLHSVSLIFGSLGITCWFCSFWAPAAGGDAFVMLAMASAIVLSLEK
jgi:hypothetical protein